MPQISVRINNRIYDLACGEGEEAHVEQLAATVDACIVDLRTKFPSAPEARLLLMAALMFADRAQELENAAGLGPAEPAPDRLDSADKLAAAFEELISARVDTIAAKLNAA